MCCFQTEIAQYGEMRFELRIHAFALGNQRAQRSNFTLQIAQIVTAELVAEQLCLYGIICRRRKGKNR